MRILPFAAIVGLLTIGCSKEPQGQAGQGPGPQKERASEAAVDPRTEVLAAVDAATGSHLVGQVAVETVSIADLRALFEDQRTVGNLPYRDEDLDERARGTMAYFSIERQAILLNDEAIEQSVPKDEREAFEKAVLIHEAAHAAAEERFEYTDKLNGLRQYGPARAMLAVVKGHAQHLTRKLCRDLGCTDGFWRLLLELRTLPFVGVPMVEAPNEQRQAFNRALFEDGERFVTAVIDKEGLEGLEALFKTPPRSFRYIKEPDRYLAGERTIDIYPRIEAGLAKLEGFAGWEESLAERSVESLVAELGNLDPGPVSEVAKRMRYSWAMSSSPAPDRSAGVAIMVFDDAQAAAAWRDLVTQSVAMRLAGAEVERNAVDGPAVGSQMRATFVGPQGRVVLEQTVVAQGKVVVDAMAVPPVGKAQVLAMVSSVAEATAAAVQAAPQPKAE